MNGVDRAVTALKDLEQNKQAAKGLQVQIDQLEADMAAATEMGYIRPRIDEDGPEYRIRNLIDRKKVLEKQHRALVGHTTHVQQVLNAMGEDPAEVLTTFFCSGLTPGAAVVRLEMRLNVSRSEVYRIRERVLKEFAYRMGYAVEG